jgi:ABC-type transport system involved in Fe-S cluster assembly fused permease/ATPase subunit
MSRLFSFLEMSLLSFNHLLNLSFAWHTQRNTGEVLKILDRGAAINNAFQVRASLFLLSWLSAHLP